MLKSLKFKFRRNFQFLLCLKKKEKGFSKNTMTLNLLKLFKALQEKM